MRAGGNWRVRQADYERDKENTGAGASARLPERGGSGHTGDKTHVLPARARLRDGGVLTALSIGGVIRSKLPAVLRCSNKLPVSKNENTGKSTTPRPYASRGAKGGVLSKESTAHIEKMVGRETKRKKKKEQEDAENDIVKRPAENGLI